MGYPPEAPLWASEDDYREEMVTHWIRGSDAIAPDVIARWVVELAQRRPPKAVRPPAAPTGDDEPKLALPYPEAARLLDYSVDHFERHVVPDLRIVVAGRRKTVPRSELVRWLEVHAARALRGDR